MLHEQAYSYEERERERGREIYPREQGVHKYKQLSIKHRDIYRSWFVS